ncbi:hypothetical protein ACFSRY_13860 [Pontibacter locisalis]|uniref:SWFGD domain-containing protein n=1 Tax=Pontibacter locisalis TaxID=1719035 RepID=A0ABW5INR9_9BACT
MERNEHNYDREFRNKLHHRDEDYGRDYDRSYNRSRSNENEPFENYRDRYSSQGNYYGMRDDDYEYRNVKSTNTRPSDYSSSNAGPMQDSQNRDYRSGSSSNYHYGDPNPYMGNSRNEGYESTRGTGWRSENDSGRGRGNYSGYGFGDSDRYSRQDNSYRYGGEGRRYSDFGRDEERTYDRNRSYNAGTEDSYYDRGDFKRKRHENDFGRDRDYSNRYYDGSYDDSDFRYKGEIKSVDRDRDDNYATGLYASNRSYVSDHNDSDGERTSSRQNRHHRSGPDYSANSRISSYGYDNFGI